MFFLFFFENCQEFLLLLIFFPLLHKKYKFKHTATIFYLVIPLTDKINSCFFLNLQPQKIISAVVVARFLSRLELTIQLMKRKKFVAYFRRIKQRQFSKQNHKSKLIFVNEFFSWVFVQIFFNYAESFHQSIYQNILSDWFNSRIVESNLSFADCSSTLQEWRR